jgi:hypothetical protein
MEYLGWGQTESLGTVAWYWSIVPAPDDKWMIIGRIKLKYSEENLSSATFSTTNHTWSVLALNQGLRCEKLATIDLSYCTALNSSSLKLTVTISLVIFLFLLFYWAFCFLSFPRCLILTVSADFCSRQDQNFPCSLTASFVLTWQHWPTDCYLFSLFHVGFSFFICFTFVFMMNTWTDPDIVEFFPLLRFLWMVRTCVCLKQCATEMDIYMFGLVSTCATAFLMS